MIQSSARNKPDSEEESHASTTFSRYGRFWNKAQNGTVQIYIAFIDFEKAFDSLHRESLWRILRHYGIPQKMVNVIKIIYTDVQCQVACNSHMSDSFSVKSGVKQGCIFSPFLFTLAIDWLMIEITKNGNRGFRWTLTSILEDLDYADDIGLLSNRHKDMQEKMDKLTTTAPQIGLKLNTAKTKLMRFNNKTDNPHHHKQYKQQ